MHGLAALDVGQRAQAVAIDGGKFVIVPFRRFRHQVLYFAPPFVIAYAAMNWANERFVGY